MKKILIIAGESSGDIHAANLMKELKKFDPEISFTGIGGNEMQLEGLNSLADIKDTSVVGFWEVAKKYGYFKKLLKKIHDLIDSGEFDLFIPVDYPGFNLRVAEYSRKKDLKVIYYIAPQLWAWGKKRAKKLSSAVDKLLVVFPFEVEFFNSFDINTEFVGHPLMDIPEIASADKISREKLILMMPGSREQEIKRHLQLLIDTRSILSQELSDREYFIAKARNISEEIFYPALEKGIKLTENSREMMTKAEAGIVKTGTSNLESALAGMPFVMYYKTSPISYLIGRNLVELDYLSIVNILLKRSVINELIQENATPNALAKEIMHIVNDNEKEKSIESSFKEIKELIGGQGASKRAAEIILNSI